jgi:hypothetical protein
MSARHLLAALVIPVVLAGDNALGQPLPEPPVPTAAGSAPAASAEADEDGWSFSASADIYLLPDDSDYLQPTFTADRGRLHLEARYNYEDLDTGSLWIGYNLTVDGDVTLAFTPMAAAVVGNTDGVAPGYNLAIDWWKLAFFSQSEYVIDTSDSANNFLYTWTELSVWPWDWLGAGVVVQRTRVADLGFEAEPGVLLGLAWKNASVTAYVFGLDESDQTVVVGAGLSF